MSNIPREPKLDQIVWFETHTPLWAATPTVFGVTAAQVTTVDNATKAARNAYTAVQDAKQAAKSATVSQNAKVGNMLSTGRDIVNVMKAFIENSGNTALWGQAGLEPPAPPGTAPDPTAPFSLGATLDSEGNIIVSWKTSQPRGVSGVIYSIRRSVDGGEFVLIDSVGEKTYTDETVHVGTTTVAYTVQAKRGRQMSALSPSLTLRFGRGSGGGLAITSATTGAPVSLAA